jgi:DNA-binding PadR family transcriptional regulator
MSTVRLLVLGSILRRGVSHGYAVLQDMKDWQADAWTSVKPGSVYHALDKLASQGMIAAAPSANGAKAGPARTEYRITPRGKAEFVRLLETALSSPDILQFSAGVAFMEWLPRQKVIELLERRRAALDANLRLLNSLPVDEDPVEPSRHPELIGIWAGYVRNEAATTDNILANVRAGKYGFKPERLEEEA